MFTIHYFLFNPSHSLANSLLNSCQTQNRFSCGWVGVVTILVWPQSKVSPEYGTAQTQLVNIFVWRMRQEKPHPSITILLSPQTQVQLWLSLGCDNLALLSVGQLPRLLKVTKGKTTWGSVLAGVSASPVVCAVRSRTMYRGKSISGCWCMRELRRINPISELGELFKKCRIPGT